MFNKFNTTMIFVLALILLASSSVLAEPEVIIDATTDMVGYMRTPAEYFKDYVEGASDGRIEVVIHSNEAIGSHREISELVNMGEYDMVLHSTEEGISHYLPEIEAVNMPFLIEDQIVGEQLWYGPFFEEVQSRLLEVSNLRLLGVGKNSIRRSYFQDPLRTPADIEEVGLTMRTMEVPMHVEIWEATGADAVTVPGPERYEAMETGMMDGLEGGVASTRDAGLFPLIDYIVMTDHMMSFSYWYTNEDWYNEIPEELREIIATGVEMATWEQRGLASQETQEVLRTLPDEFPHIEVIHLSDEERAQWRDVTIPVAQEFLEEVAGEDFVNYTQEKVEEAAEIVSERRRRLNR